METYSALLNELKMLHVIFVHGTFARKAKWALPDAAMAQSIQKALDGGAGALIETFDWSGGNSFKARTEAAEKLKARLQILKEGNDQIKIILVGHSHGGNVILQASNCESVLDSISGIVCLATPVLHAERRDARTAGLPVAIGPLSVLVNLAFLFLLAYSGVWAWGERRVGLYFMAAAVLLSGALSFGAMIFLFWLRDRLAERVEAAVELILASTTTPRVRSERVIFVRHPGDEATIAAAVATAVDRVLGGAAKITNMLPRFVDKKLDLMGSDGALARRLLIPFGVLVVISIALHWLFPQFRELLITLWYTSLIVGVAFIVCVAMVLITRLIASCFLALFFGHEALLAGASLRLTAEATPSGCWSVLSGSVNELSNLSRRIEDDAYPYAHGRVYDDPIFHAAVANWISARVKGVEAKTGQ